MVRTFGAWLGLAMCLLPVVVLGQDVQVQVFPERPARPLDPLVIEGARVKVAEKQDVPAQRAGKLLLLGTPVQPTDPDVPQGAELEKKIAEGKYYREKLGFLVTEAREGDNVKPEQSIIFPDNPKKKFRYVSKGESFNPGQVCVVQVEFLFRRLEVGDAVKKDQLVALVDSVVALDELVIKTTRFSGAEADRLASEKTRDEARKQFESIARGMQAQPRTVSVEDARAAELTWQRSIQEEIAKAAAVRQAEHELRGTLNQLRQYEVRAGLSGVVTALYRAPGEAVKALEPVLQIQNHRRLRVEGQVPAEKAERLKAGKSVLIEASSVLAPAQVLRGHPEAVTAVAVSRGPKSLILSGSSAGIRGWDVQVGREAWQITQREAIKSLVCTGAQARTNLLLVLGAEGSLRLFNLDRIQEQCFDFPREADRRCEAMAFSPDGSLFASAEGGCLVLWKVGITEGKNKAEKLQQADGAYRGGIHELRFVSERKLLVIDAEKEVAVWDADPGQAMRRDSTFRLDKAAGLLASDGRRLLFSQGEELHLRGIASLGEVDGWLPMRVVPRPPNLLLQLSPDGKLLLASSGANHLQLWRTPEGGERGALVRRLVAEGTPSCCAFAPDGSLLATGMSDGRILVWTLPRKEEVERRLTGHITLVERAPRDGAKRRVWAEVEDAPPWLQLGELVTIVVPEEEPKRE